MTTYTDVMTFSDNGASFDLTLTVSGSGGTGTVTEITGTADGATVTGLNSSFDSPDNIVVSTTAPQFDFNGLSFNSVGEEYNLYANNGILTLTDVAGNVGGLISDETFTVEPLCFLLGTRILTPSGEVRLENLAIGDVVVTRFGGIRPIKWIGRQTYNRRVIGLDGEHNPVCIRAGALGPNMPLRDLFVSPGHSMLIENTLVLARALVNGLTITQASGTRVDGADDLSYLQLDLGSHDCVIAEGVWSETFADGPSSEHGLRGKFHNVGEFLELYPDVPPAEELVLCAPRPLRGPALETLLAPIAAHAAATVGIGPLEGCVDAVIGRWDIEGWALDTHHPELPVTLDVFLEGSRIGSVLACNPRNDLREAGKGRGRCAFRFRSPVRLLPAALASLSIRRASDGVALRMTGQCKQMIAAAQDKKPALEGLWVVA